MRIIPGKTKVQIELFKGISIIDMAIALVCIAIIILTLVSSITGNWIIALVEGLISALLLARLDKEPNYIFLLNILRHIGYPRRYQKMYLDNELFQIADKGFDEVAFDEVFDENEDNTPDVEEHVETAKERKERLKREKAEYKADTKLLKSKKLTKEEEDAIWLKRAQKSADKKSEKKEIKEKNASWYEMEDIVGYRDIKDGFIEYMGGYYGAVIEIPSVEFRFFSEHRRKNSIENALGSVLRAARIDYAMNIVKIERPINYDKYVDLEYSKLEELRKSYEQGMLTEEELQSRVEVLYDRANELESFNREYKIIVPFYYLVLYDNDKKQLNRAVDDAINSLVTGELTPKRLNDREIALFLKYSNQLDFNEDDIDKVRPEDYAKWAMPDTVEIKHRAVLVNSMITHNLRAINYPSAVGDAWLASLMTFPATKVVVKATPMDRGKSISTIDRSLSELRGKYISAKTDSEVIELKGHIETLQSLLFMLQNDNEGLMNVNVYVTAYDAQGTVDDPKVKNFEYVTFRERITNMKKTVRRVYSEQGIRLNHMEFNQTRAFIGSQVNAYDPMLNDGRGMPSNTIAAMYPWIFSNIMDEKGFKFGFASGVPVMVDFFRRDSERVNSNVVIVGKSGSGKSYATKSLLANLAGDDAKIFILDPENEYSELAKNLNGKFINVANSKYGRLNPFHVITTLDDDEGEESGENSGYSTHLQFLEEFFRQILPECETDSLEYLNTLVDRVYQNKGINHATDFSKLKPEDYPIFDDLYDEILKEFQRTDNEYIRTMLRTLMNYISKFSTGGRNSVIWNGPSTVTTDENFTVFNFQSLLSNRNGTIANAQMLLVLKYIDNEIIKNRDFNTKYGLNRKIVVVIDEAHVFIDTKFPVALDFMFQLAKRIRKYNGMQIVITQNIKDFVGSEDIARKSSAIINACQYSLIFPLAPNDIADLCKLYEKAGGINENEQEQIMQAPRGQAFSIMSPTNRSTFQVTVPDEVVSLFSDQDRYSAYFSGLDGMDNWEKFIGDSRKIREANLAELKNSALQETSDETPDETNTVSFAEITEEELALMTRTEPETPLEQTEAFWKQPKSETLLKQPESEVSALSARAPEQVVQPQIIVQAPESHSKTEELLAEIINKFSYNSLMDEIKRTVKSEVEQAGLRTEPVTVPIAPVASVMPVTPETAEPIQTAVETKQPELDDSFDFSLDSLFGSDDLGQTELIDNTSNDDEFVDLFSELFADESEPSEKSDDSAPLGNIFELAGIAREQSQQPDSDFDDSFDIMELLRQDAEKLESISPIDEMITYDQYVCDLTLEQLTEYINREHL